MAWGIPLCHDTVPPPAESGRTGGATRCSMKLDGYCPGDALGSGLEAKNRGRRVATGEAIHRDRCYASSVEKAALDV